MALQIAEFARESHKMHEWIDVVYHANFVEGKDIGEAAVLLDLAEQIGLDIDKVHEVLDSSCYAYLLREHDQECTAKKVEWVPTIFAGEEKILEGAFTFTVFEETISALVRE